MLRAMPDRTNPLQLSGLGESSGNWLRPRCPIDAAFLVRPGRGLNLVSASLRVDPATRQYATEDSQ